MRPLSTTPWTMAFQMRAKSEGRAGEKSPALAMVPFLALSQHAHLPSAQQYAEPCPVQSGSSPTQERAEELLVDELLAEELLVLEEATLRLDDTFLLEELWELAAGCPEEFCVSHVALHSARVVPIVLFAPWGQTEQL